MPILAYIYYGFAGTTAQEFVFFLSQKSFSLVTAQETLINKKPVVTIILRS